MIPIYKISPSGDSTWDHCPHQFFISYHLNLPRSNTVKTLKGTITHKVLEILAKAKKNIDAGQKIVNDEVLGGDYDIDMVQWLKPRHLSSIEIETINKSRKDKKKFKTPVFLPDNAVRYGDVYVNNIISLAYTWFTAKYSDLVWTQEEWQDVNNFVWIVLEGGIYDPRFKKIVATEQFFDIPILMDWAKYSYNMPDGSTKEGHLSIRGVIDLVVDAGDGVYEVIDWKGLPIDTKLPTPYGWTTMGEVKVGDILFDKDGLTTKVLGKSIKKYKPLYKIYFDDKTNVICDCDHLWLLNNNNVVPVKNLVIGDKIDVTKSIDTKKVNLPIDPYVLGIWLGDGRNKNGEISNNDTFIFQEIEKRGYKIGQNIHTKGCPSRTIYGLVTKLKTLNLLNNKHIPDIYLRASHNQRLDLLRGLMDSDGNVNSTRKQAVFTNCNKLLSNNVKELILSLGQRPNQSLIKRFIYNKWIEIYPIHFRPININPFLLPRKANKIDKEWSHGRSNVRRITQIESMNINQETQCISVDSSSKTYLCTENFIPTHNTGQRLDFATGEVKDLTKLHSDKQLMLYYYAIKNIYKDVKDVMLSMFFIRDGGPFSVCLDNKTLIDVEKHLKKRFKEIQSCVNPRLHDARQYSFKCKYLCDFYKIQKNGTNLCKYVEQQIKINGIQAVIKEFFEEQNVIESTKD